MLEGAVARLLNQLLGKYVVDLDTENLNVGIFSGQVQLTDLKLKTEALYELNLPIEVIAGTIGKVTLTIPWSTLWNQPIKVNIEDVHIIVGPIVTDQAFDAEKNKRLLRAVKKNLLAKLETDSQILGGPTLFAEHLVTNLLNYLQLNVTNVHVRYEDAVSCATPLAAGLCIGTITAETTNSKWRKSSKIENNADVYFYLVKIEAFSVYWNSNNEPQTWTFPTDYYQWRNAMGSSLQNYNMNGQEFEFLLNPTTAKIKMSITKSSKANKKTLNTDIVVQDCNLEISKKQYESITTTADSLKRMLISWNYLAIRPHESILTNKKIWWQYALNALLEQRIRPYSWSRIKTVRNHYKEYIETYKQIILNPNDTELKLDLQKFEDNLSVINVVIARQQTRLILQSRSVGEKNFWSMLPSPERILLCEKIGYFENEDKNSLIEHNFNFRLGNLNACLINDLKEIMVITLTQSCLAFQPNYTNGTFKLSAKIEGLIIEGANNNEEHLLPIISSEHLSDSPAYFFKCDLEKLESSSYKLNVVLDSVECIYNKQSFEELEDFFTTNLCCVRNLLDYLREVPVNCYQFLREKLLQGWDLTLNIKVPYLVVPDNNSYLKADHLLVVDFGRYIINTEITRKSDVSENATLMEMEEQLYSKLHIQCSDLQVLFCDNSENWKEARFEKDTEMHIIPKTNFTSIYAICVTDLATLPKTKFNLNFPSMKINLSERKSLLLLKFFNKCAVQTKLIKETLSPCFVDDRVTIDNSQEFLLLVQNLVRISNVLAKNMRKTVENHGSKSNQNEKKLASKSNSEMNEAWARMVDLPGLEDNISPNNNISILFGFVINEFSLVFSRSSDSADRQYLMLRLGGFSMDIANMTYGPAYQFSINNIFLTDKLHTTSSGQYLDLLHSPLQSNIDVVTVLYRKVSASCPDFWTHFHGVETSLVANFGTVHVLLHQEAVHTIIKYSKYFSNKVRSQLSPFMKNSALEFFGTFKKLLDSTKNTPVPPGSVKFSHSARLSDLHVTVCDADFDIVHVHLSGLEMDFLFRANERFVFRSYLSSINVEHLSDITLYSKVFSTDEDKVFDIKYVRNEVGLSKSCDISPNREENLADGSFKFHLGRIHCTFLYKLVVQLQRFVINLEALPFLEKSINLLKQAISKATDTLKVNTKINLSINIFGPVLLIPQKSSSPNVMIIDTGNLKVENYFKESPNDRIENILVKLAGFTVTRGVMTLAQTLEMQETLIEPLNTNLDIKRYTNSATSKKSWDIDSVIDCIKVTLGQKDLSIILAIYTDNIGEGKLVDLFPNQLKSPIEQKSNADDKIVKSLEIFFCEPKQKNIVAKCCIEEIQLLLFFDSGELLSSPIRDLNHGLCKLDFQEIDTSIIVYTDQSLDGKLSIDTVSIEEIGPDANAFDKTILESPMDDNKNNNCNITVNKPPIVDVTFHQNKSQDKSADVIIGRLSLSLSVPFCEKITLFVIECLPKDNLEMGIVNAGYEAESHHQQKPAPSISTSLTISLRVNKPEFIFLVETTSNKKRFFITKMEILLDYSRHANRLNLVTSFSGLHTLFYDLGIYSSDPYVILKQCDVEFCNNYSEDKGEKITLAVSSVYVKLCSEVVHSINDILNDIAEHFKVPTEGRKVGREVKDEDLWEPKKMNDFIETPEESIVTTTFKKHKSEVFLIPKFEIVLILELEQIQVFLLKSTVELTLYDWSSLLNCTCECTLQANYFNESVQQWEPVIDPVSLDEKDYKPWDVLIKIFQDKSMNMLDEKMQVKQSSQKMKKAHHSYATTEEEDSGEDMMYLEPINAMSSGSNRRVKTSLSTFLDDSDSENEDGAVEKLAAAISDLFTGDWNENDASDCEQSSDGDDEDEEDVAPCEKTKQQDAIDFKKSFYVLVDAKEILNVTISPRFLKVFNELLTMYTNKILSVYGNRKQINLVNDIGPLSKVELYEKKTSEDENCLLSAKTFENQDSAPNSPVKIQLIPDLLDTNHSDEFNNSNSESLYDFETLSSLNFPLESTSSLFDRIHKNYLKIYIPHFQPIQTNCSNRTWEKLIRLHPINAMQTYHLLAKHTIGKNGRSLVISSPLQIKNETCFPLSVLYQPDSLKEMNLEVNLGEVTNPFESIMRIAVLEAYENYNVPLFIAYHCKIFIQPAYAECQYASNSGIWWKDLVNDLDAAHNLICKPKTADANVEPFALRVVLKRNVQITNLHMHSIPNYTIHLLPPLILHNFLPYAIEIEHQQVKQTIKVEPSEKANIYALDLSSDQKLVVKVRRNSTVWSGSLNLTTHLDEKVVLVTSEAKESLSINIKCEREGSCNLFFYTPYWIVNKTTLPLQIKASATNSVYESLTDEILLFTYKRHGKQTLNIRVYESNWSNEFGLECAGTTGLVVCKDQQRKKKYMFFLQTKLSTMCPRLTKIVTLLPSFLISNDTNQCLRFMEHNEKTDLWIDLPPFRTIVFWPETSTMQMYVKQRDSKLVSQAFLISNQHRTVLRLDKTSALTVDVTGGVNESFRISFNDYKPGDAPILVKNYCADVFLKIQQQDQSPVTLLSPYHSLLYIWDDPTRPRQLVWNVYNNKGPGFVMEIHKDGYGEEKIKFQSVTPNTSLIIDSSSSEDSDSCDSVQTTLNKKVRKDKIVIYWLCYREDLQRILLFTQESRIFDNVLKAKFQEQCNFQCLLSLAGVGLSIFTDDNLRKEHVYACLSDTPAIWEVNVGQKWKTLTLELASWIEDKYRIQCKKCQLRDYIHIDFEKMFMLKPFFAELRRTYHSAVYFHYRKSNNLQYFNLKLQAMQIDNQQTNSIILHQLPAAVNIKDVSPFFDVKVSKSVSANCTVYRYVKLEVGNFYVNVENDLWIKLCQLLNGNRKFVQDVSASYVNDISFIHKQITAPNKQILEDSSTVIESVHLSGCGIQVNVSNKIPIALKSNCVSLEKVLDYLFPVNISPYMPMEGVHHKINSMELIDLKTTFWSCITNLLHQIASQFVQQYYSHVLGLQVLVNSFAIQPAIDTTEIEPEKISTLLLYGSRCLLGHINMSPAALEQCINEIFAHQNMENIQRIRRHGSYHHSEILPRSITASSTNFNTGVPNALRQLIVKNQNGINCDGEMFFRTTGKALLSLLTRHPQEKSNSVEVAKEALRRASNLGEPIKIHQRLARYSNKYLGLKPISVYESMGEFLLETVASYRFLQDVYWAHAAIDKVGKSIVVVSLQHVFRINKCRLWGNWDVEWVVDLDDIVSMPKVVGVELVLNMRQGDTTNEEQIKVVGEKEMLLWLHEKIEQAIIVSMEDKSWTLNTEN